MTSPSTDTTAALLERVAPDIAPECDNPSGWDLALRRLPALRRHAPHEAENKQRRPHPTRRG